VDFNFFDRCEDIALSMIGLVSFRLLFGAPVSFFVVDFFFLVETGRHCSIKDFG